MPKKKLPKKVRINLEKYGKEKSIDSRFLVLLGYNILDEQLSKISTSESITNFEQKLNRHPLRDKFSLHEPVKLIKFLRELKNSLSHNYLTEEEFNSLLEDHKYISLKTKRKRKFHLGKEYDRINLNNKEELVMLILNLACLIDIVERG